jgi:transcription initiation factor IIE alpha subunit
MERYYVSIADPNPTPQGFTPFRKDLFNDLVRFIMCSFYDDGEIMVVNFLLESDVAHTDQQIGEALGLPQRQVRAILEARLCKEFITEAEVPNQGIQSSGSQGNPYIGGASAWYRICPDILSATWYRLSQTERAISEKLKSVQETESYVCEKCGGREFDALRAVSLFSQADGLFHCDICDDVLQMRENKQIRERLEGLLTAFYGKFEVLKERLESMARMFVPRPIVIKKTVHEKLLDQAKKESQTNGVQGQLTDRATFTQFSAAMNNLVTCDSTGSRPSTAAAPEWIREAQAPDSRLPYVTSDMTELTIAKKPKVETKIEAKQAISESLAQAPFTDIKTVIESVTKKEEVKEENFLEDVNVFVQGRLYKLSEIQENESLIDRMTDEEYTSYDSIIQQRLGMK